MNTRHISIRFGERACSRPPADSKGIPSFIPFASSRRPSPTRQGGRWSRPPRSARGASPSNSTAGGRPTGCFPGEAGRRFVIGQPPPPEQTRWHQAMRVLIVDDEPSIRRTTRVAVESSGHSASEAPNAAKAVKAAEEEGFDAVFLDLKLGADDGLEVLGRLMRVRPAPAGILFTAYANIATAVEAMRRGAFDFIPKPFTPDQIRSVLAKVAKAHALELRVQALESDLASGAPPVDLESAEPAMLRSLQVAFKAAETPANILILGSSGTGKSVLAREIHKRSARRDAAFVTVNCPSLSRELLESELFGHAKGSFTGAFAETAGKVAAADGGTLFLDEIGELPLEIQPKLLRLLQEREYERVGEALPRRADVRVVAASNRDLAAEAKASRFREDLFYRLNVIAISLPGLRERPADLKRLAEGARRYFAMRAGKGQMAVSKAGANGSAQGK